MNMTTQKTLYLANPYGFSAQQRQGPLQELVAALESKGAQVWEPFARNNQIDQTSPNWAYRNRYCKGILVPLAIEGGPSVFWSIRVYWCPFVVHLH